MFRNTEKIPLVVLFGPTASGKTKLAVDICKDFNGEVVTADSMQVYKGMDIGTAKPDFEEMQGIKHHMIDLVEPDQNYSLAQYVTEAKACIEEIAGRGKLPVLAGGTGLYIDTLVDNISLSEDERDEEYRKQLYEVSEAQGNEVLMNMLKKVDFESYEKLHVNDTKRIIRALEVFKTTGIPQSEHIRLSRQKDTPYNAVKFCLTGDREALYDRINKRVDMMFEAGLLDEVSGLYARGIDERYTSMQGIGYKEVLWHLQGKISLEECKEQIKQSTRRYAKRQVSWFKREQNTVNIDMNSEKKSEIYKKCIALTLNL